MKAWHSFLSALMVCAFVALVVGVVCLGMWLDETYPGWPTVAYVGVIFFLVMWAMVHALSYHVPRDNR